MRYKKNIILLYERTMLFFDFFLSKIIRKHPVVLSFEDTISLIKLNNKSLCRFGDGEFAIMSGHNIKFQRFNPILAKRLKIIMGANNKNLLISLPDVFFPNPNYTKNTNDYWLKEIAKYRLMVYRLINKELTFGNAFISRPYMNWIDKENSGKRFKILFELWEERDLLIVEGDKTRMGVGNDIFKKAKSIKRILLPSENAFFRYDDILKIILKHHNNELVLISAGPTAKLLVYDLFESGIQALDIGHIDLEYEWFLKSALKKIIIDGKYTSEVNDGEFVHEVNSSEYLSEIVDVIE